MSDYKLGRFKKHVTLFIILVSGSWFLVSLAGCEAFVRKFTRKPKEEQKETPILEPQVYPDIIITNEQLYKDYFLFWESWSEELISFLNVNSNFKKQKQCADEALDNLLKMQSILNEDKARELDAFIVAFTKLRDRMSEGGINGSEISLLRDRVIRIKSRVHRNFVYSKVQKDFR